MLNLCDPTVKPEAAELDCAGSPQHDERQSGRLTHTTAGQLLFLMENPDTLDRRIGTLA